MQPWQEATLDAAIYTAGTILQLQSTMEFHRQLIHQHHLQSHLHCGNDPRVANHNEIPSATHPPAPLAIPFTLRERSYSCKAQWNSIGNSSTSTTCNPIYSEGTILKLQITMEFHQQLIHQHHLQPHLQCGNDPTVANHNGILSTTHARKTVVKPHLQCGTDPTMIRPWSEHDPSMIRPHTRPSRTRRTAEVDHRGSGTHFCMEKHRVSCICYLSKTHFVRDFLQNSIGNSSTSTTCNPIYSEGTILELQITMQFHQQLIHQHHLHPIYNAGTIRQLQITMEFCRPHMHEKQLTPHLQCGTDPTMIRPWSEHDPSMIRPHTRPSRTRRTAEVDHRGSGTHFVWKKHRVSCICYLSKNAFRARLPSKTPSATPPPAPLAIPFTLRERSYSCKSQCPWLTLSLTNSFFD